MPSPILSPEQQSKLAQTRAKVLAGTATIEDMREAVIIMREGRQAAQLASAKGKSKGSSPRAPINTDALFAELDTKA